MIISVVNHSSKTDGEVREAIRAVNRQIERDFEPHWDLGASVHLAATASRIRATGRDRVAVVHLRKSWNEDEHLPTPVGAATGWVFTAIGPETEATVPWLHWTVALSHEILELVADPDLNTLIKGPHPAAKREVFH